MIFNLDLLSILLSNESLGFSNEQIVKIIEKSDLSHKDFNNNDLDAILEVLMFDFVPEFKAICIFQTSYQKTQPPIMCFTHKAIPMKNTTSRYLTDGAIKYSAKRMQK